MYRDGPRFQLKSVITRLTDDACTKMALNAKLLQGGCVLLVPSAILYKNRYKDEWWLVVIAVAGSLQCLSFVLTTFFTIKDKKSVIFNNLIGLICIAGYMVLLIVAYLACLVWVIQKPDTQVIAYYWMFRCSFRMIYLFAKQESTR